MRNAMKYAAEKRERQFKIFFAVVAIMAVLMIAGTIGLTCAVLGEIDDCGGVASCLGEAAKDFDEARKGE